MGTWITDSLRGRGAYAAAILEHPLPWTKMRQVYRLLGLARRHGAAETDTACARALEVEVVSVGLIERILTRGLAGVETMTRCPSMAPDEPGPVSDTAADRAAVVPAAGRFARDPGEFSTRRPS